MEKNSNFGRCILMLFFLIFLSFELYIFIFIIDLFFSRHLLNCYEKRYFRMQYVYKILHLKYNFKNIFFCKNMIICIINNAKMIQIFSVYALLFVHLNESFFLMGSM